MIGVNQEKWEAGESMITNTNGGKLRRPSSSYKKLLDRVTFWIVYIAWTVGYKIVPYNVTSVGIGRKNRLFGGCVAETVLLLLLLSILLCQNRQVKGPNKCKHEISDSLHYSIFFILFCYTKLRADPLVNKDFFLFKFFSIDSLSCSKVEATHVYTKSQHFKIFLRIKLDAPLSSADVKFLLNQRREAKFVIASFLWASIVVQSISKLVCKGDC